jgi:glycosyltransferase involved in cell wall biosynthesis
VRPQSDAELVTIGVVSYNRLEYLRVMLDSARACIQYPNLQWIVVDGGSIEPGLREYLESLDFADELRVDACTHAEAMNTIVELAVGDYILLLPEDVQFVRRGPWLADLVELVRDRRRIGHVTFDVQRKKTIERAFLQAYVRTRGRTLRIPFMRRPYRRYRTSSGAEFLGYGKTRDGVNGAGIMSFCRTEIWRTLGQWRAVEAPRLSNDSGLGAEDDMLRRYRESGLRLEAVMMRFPAAADIVTDPRGTKAKIRGGNRRYGRYAPPPSGRFYYRIWETDDLVRFCDADPAPGFEDYVEPIGFPLPLDDAGGLLKTSVINETEPYELVGAL